MHLKLSPMRLVIIASILMTVVVIANLDWTLSKINGERPETSVIALANLHNFLFPAVLIILSGFVFLFTRNIMLVAATFLSGFIILHGGLEDIIYFIVSNRPVPYDLPWLNQAIPGWLATPVTSPILYTSAAITTSTGILLILLI